MHPTLRTLAVATLLAASFAPAARAGGMGATLDGPAKDGVTYTVHTYACSGSEMTAVTGSAEGVVHGERRTLPLVLAGERGTYTFQRTWPREGRWLVRLAFEGGHAPAMVAELGHDGRVRANKLLWDSDGRRECDTRLAAATR